MVAVKPRRIVFSPRKKSRHPPARDTCSATCLRHFFIFSCARTNFNSVDTHSSEQQIFSLLLVLAGKRGHNILPSFCYMNEVCGRQTPATVQRMLRELKLSLRDTPRRVESTTRSRVFLNSFYPQRCTDGLLQYFTVSLGNELRVYLRARGGVVSDPPRGERFRFADTTARCAPTIHPTSAKPVPTQARRVSQQQHRHSGGRGP
mmetsp:Transcript_353/g.1040  ORF Transcript_353/g.1040 Transcript_353/m.1040 type:complete len:204 (+) Transcript_353:160-771(+)